MPEKAKYVKLKNYEKKKKNTPFIFHEDFESILVPEDNENQKPEYFDTYIYQKHFFSISKNYVTLINKNKLINLRFKE